MRTTELLTNSRRSAFQRCRREAHLAYDLGVRPRSAPTPLALGTVVHAGLEAWWRAWQDGRGDVALELSLATARLAHAAVDDEVELDAYELVRAEEMLRGYHFRWAGDAPRMRVLAVEAAFEGPLVNPATGRSSRTWRLAGKVDAIVEVDGLTLVVEHKTSSQDISPGSLYWTKLRMDGQVSMYYQGARILGYEPDGCMYDVLRKPAQRPLRATPEDQRKYTKTGELYARQRTADETPEEFRARVAESIAPLDYERGIVRRLEGEVNEFIAELWVTARGMAEAARTGAHVRNPDACERYGRLCPYFDVCTGAASIDDPARFRRTAQHPELDVAP